MSLSIIAALARNRVIGRGNQLPWHLPEDLAHFKKLTLGHTLIMGRKTYESIGRPLPGRRTIVVSRKELSLPPGVRLARSIDDALKSAEGESAFIAGGAEIYRQTLDRVDRLYLTMIDADVEGDALFPAYDPADWQVAETEMRETRNPRFPRIRFLTLERASASAALERVDPVPQAPAPPQAAAKSAME